MSIALWPSDRKLARKIKQEFALPYPVWGRLWFLFGCCYGEGVVSEKQFRALCCPYFDVEPIQRLSKEQVQEIAFRIGRAIAYKQFDRDTQEWNVWDRDTGIRVPDPESPGGSVGDVVMGDGGMSVGTAAKTWWPRFWEFVNTVGLNGFSVQG